MANILDLPNELLFSIFSYVDRTEDDLVHLAVTCKHLFGVAEGSLREHKGLREKYEFFKCEDSGELQNTQCTSWNLLYDILKNPRHGPYIRELQLPEDRTYEWEGDEEWYSTALQRSSSLDPDVPDFIASMSDDRIIMGLFIVLIRLRSLEYCHHGEARATLDYVETVAKDYKNYAAEPIALAFHYLTTVSFSYWATEGCISFKWLYYFSRIPSVRSVSGHMVGGDVSEEEIISMGSEFLPPTATTLSLAESCIGMGALEALLAGASDLKFFSYEYGGAIVDYFEWDPKAVYRLLVKYAKDSLESLKVIDGGPDDIESEIARSSLSEMKKLRLLDTDWNALLPDPDLENVDLNEALSPGFFTEDTETLPEFADVLPASLEVLKLRRCDDNWLTVLKIFLEKKPECCPQLEELKFSIRGQVTQEGVTSPDIEELVEAAKRVGVEARCLDETDLSWWQ